MNNIDWGYLFGMALQTVPEPRKIARDVFAFGAPRRALWLILALLLVAMTFLGVITSILFPVDPAAVEAVLAEEDLILVPVDPILTGIFQSVTALMTVWGIHFIGRAFGGRGGFDEALLTVIWLHYVLLLMQIGIVTLNLFAPALALLLTFMSFVMSFWLLSHFIAEMHGFRSAGSVFAGIMMVLLVLAVVLSILLTILAGGAPVETAMGVK